MRRLTLHSHSAGAAALVGGVLTAGIGAALGWQGQDLSHAAQASLFALPVLLTATIGGRAPAFGVAALATLLFDLVLPPAGHLRLQFTDDVVALGAFSLVAFAGGGLVGLRIDTLDRLERQRAALLRSVSHDLRTPLSTVRAAVSAVESGTLNETETRRLLQIAGEETDRLDRLVGNLLSLARIEGGGLMPRRQAVDLAELVEGCVERLQRTMHLSTVTVAIDDDLPSVHVDHMLIDQVVTNLLENAARHGPPDAPITVTAREVDDALEVVVTDQGPGIPAAERERMFEAFRSTDRAGTGIGLAICKAIVEAHGGTIGVGESQLGGTSIGFRLPT